MATLDSLQFEMERRVALYTWRTTMPDDTSLGFNADPNTIVTPSTAGETLLYNAPVSTRYATLDSSANVIQEYFKQAQPSTWLPLGSGTDASLAELEARVDALDASVIRIDASILELYEITNVLESSIGRIDASIAGLYDLVDLLDSSIVDLYDTKVSKSGDIMTGDLSVSGVDITNDLSVSGGAVIIGDVQIGGDLTIDGSVTYVHSIELDISTNFIKLNTGLTGTPPAWLQSGIIVERGDLDPYVFTFDETDQTFRIGIAAGPDASGTFPDSSTQAVATREDNPIANAISVWNDVLRRFDTCTGLTFSGEGLYVDGSLKVSSLSGTGVRFVTTNADGTLDTSIISFEGVFVKEASIGDTLTWDSSGFLQVDLSILDYIDSSIDDLYSRVNIIDSSIEKIDSSIIDLYGKSASLDASVIRIDSSIIELYDKTLVIDSCISELYDKNLIIDSSIERIDASINDLYSRDVSIGIKNIGDGDASIFYGIDSSEFSFRELKAKSSKVTLDVSEGVILIDVSISDIPSSAGIDGGVWITDITPTSGGNVGDKVTSSDGNVLDSCLTDVSSLTVHVLALPGHTNYKPIVTINGNPVSLSADSDKPLWEGTYNIQYDFADASITVVHEDGARWSTTVDADTPAVIQSATFINGYPGSQSELKAGDTFDVSIMTDVSISSVIVDNFGAATGGTYAVNGNNVGFTITIADRGTSTQALGLRLRVVKSTGSTSANYLTSSQGSVDGKDLVNLNNTYPSISFGSITYPGSQSAIKTGESATVNHTVTGFDTISYTSPGGQLTIASPTTYQAAKNVDYLAGTYNISTNNFSVSATRNANNASSSNSTVVWIAAVAPTLSVSNPASRLRSGGNDGTSAQNHIITINSNQRLQSAPTLVKDTGGTWLGTGFSWSAAATSFTRTLQVHDDDVKATYNWGAISGTGLAGLTSTTNTGTATYVLGGFVQRTISVAAFGWQSNINVEVSDYSKLSSTGSGQNLAWSVKALPTRSTIGDTTRPQASTWSASATFTNPTTINILDKAATDSASQASSFTIQEGI